MQPAKFQTPSSESSLGVFWIATDANFLLEDNEDSDRSTRMSEGTHVAVQFLFFSGSHARQSKVLAYDGSRNGH